MTPSLALPACVPLALVTAISLCFAAPALAQNSNEAVPAVFVTGVRFTSDPQLLPIGATVITGEQIRSAGATDVNQAIRKIGGVYGRQSLDASPDFALDLRGFGANSSQNLVVVVDGVRISENELGGAVLANIPVESVERIEIIRGGSSVLFGEGATGGVIQIVTKRPAKGGLRGSVGVEAGQFGLRNGRASLAQSFDGFSYDVAAGDERTDNDRANNRFKQTSFSGGVQWNWRGGRAGLRLESARQDARFAGSLTLAQFEADPHQATTPKDFGTLDLDRVKAYVEQRFGSTDVAAELAHRQRKVAASYYSSYGLYQLAYSGDQTQFSPRLRHLDHFDGMLNEIVTGIDLMRWSRLTDSASSKADASQKSKAVYLRDELKWDSAHDARVSLGVRRELFDKNSFDPVPYTSATYHATQAQNAWEAQSSYRFDPLVELYVKAGQSYRVANADENSYTNTANVALKAQTSHDLELGAAFGDSVNNVNARLFRHRLVNEIFYDPTAGYGANVNLDPTRRQGLEVDTSARIDAAWRLVGHLQHVSAQFTAGPNAGREMVLVPKNVVTARLAWAEAGQSADLGAQWVASQRYGSDFTNTCGARIPSYVTLDARYGYKIGAWEFAATGLNLADKHYFSNAFGCKAGIYPSDGRQLKLSARYDF